MRYAGLRVAAFGRFSQIKIWMTIDSPTPPPLSLLLFPEPTVVQVLFEDSSVVLMLLLTLTCNNIVQPLTFGCSNFYARTCMCLNANESAW